MADPRLKLDCTKFGETCADILIVETSGILIPYVLVRGAHDYVPLILDGDTRPDDMPVVTVYKKGVARDITLDDIVVLLPRCKKDHSVTKAFNHYLQSEG